MSRVLFCMLLATVCCACMSGKKKSDTVLRQETAVVHIDSVVHDAILALPEIQARAAFIDSATHGTRKLLVWTSAEPTVEEPYYRVDAGEDNGTELVAHFHFFVTPGTPPFIRIYDPVADTVLTLQQWRADRD